jgi:hypothetical protein
MPLSDPSLFAGRERVIKGARRNFRVCGGQFDAAHWIAVGVREVAASYHFHIIYGCFFPLAALRRE